MRIFVDYVLLRDGALIDCAMRWSFVSICMNPQRLAIIESCFSIPVLGFYHVLNCLTSRGGDAASFSNVQRRAHFQRTDTSYVADSRVPEGSGILGSMGNEALRSLPSTSEQQCSSADTHEDRHT